MIGIDIIKIERIKKMIERFGDKALKRFLCDEEIALVKSAQSAAGYWALKEAVAKALGSGVGSEFSFHDVRIYKTEKNAPKIRLSNRVIERFGVQSASVSITHDEGYAVAVAVLETKEQERLEGF